MATLFSRLKAGEHVTLKGSDEEPFTVAWDRHKLKLTNVDAPGTESVLSLTEHELFEWLAKKGLREVEAETVPGKKAAAKKTVVKTKPKPKKK